jgi:hypothetical protein
MTTINWPITRNDIQVNRDENCVIHILVGDDKNSFSVSCTDSPMTAIKVLMENISRKVLGVTEHDFIMKVNDLFEREEYD